MWPNFITIYLNSDKDFIINLNFKYEKTKIKRHDTKYNVKKNNYIAIFINLYKNNIYFLKIINNFK